MSCIIASGKLISYFADIPIINRDTEQYFQADKHNQSDIVLHAYFSVNFTTN